VFRSPGPIALAFRVPPDLPLVGGLVVSIRWYGVLIASAMALGLWLAAREAARRDERPDDLLRAAEFALIGGLVGARLYYVLFNLDYYQSQPWWRTFAVWEGGLAIHGGLIAGLLAGGTYVWMKHLPLRTYLDTVAPSLALGQAIGRWGNFFNEDAGRRRWSSTSTSTPPFSTSRSGTSPSSSSSTSGCAGDSSGRPAPCSSPISACTRSAASGWRACGRTA
jgi:prolipoprotein diacylglyceryl transferase